MTSVTLQRNLEKSLRRRLLGSPECEVTWKEWVTPWGQCLSKPRARVRRSIEIAIGLWPTVSTEDHKSDGPKTMAEIRSALEEGRPIRQSAQRLRNFVKMALWPAAQSHDGSARGNTLADHHHYPHDLPNAVNFALWPSATTPSGGQRNPKGTSITGKRPDGAKATVTLQNVVLACWPAATSNAKPTPDYNEAGNSAGQVAQREILLGLWPANQAIDHKSGAVSPATLHSNSRPVNEAVLALWSALRSTDGAKGGPNRSFGAGGSPLPSQVARTAKSNLSSAPTASGAGSLHPEFAGWAMQYPIEWLNCAPLEMRLCRNARKRL